VPVIDGQKICPSAEMVYCWKVSAVETGYALQFYTGPDEQTFELEPRHRHLTVPLRAPRHDQRGRGQARLVFQGSALAHLGARVSASALAAWSGSSPAALPNVAAGGSTHCTRSSALVQSEDEAFDELPGPDGHRADAPWRARLDIFSRLLKDRIIFLAPRSTTTSRTS